RLPPRRVRRAVPAPGAGTPVLLQALRARRAAEIEGRRDEAGRGGGHAGARGGNGSTDGDVREAEAVRALVAVSLACCALLGRGEKGAVTVVPRRDSSPHRTVPLPSPFSPSFQVVVLPAGLRGMMSAVWIQNNRHWDELAGQNTLTQLLGTGTPSQREYLGCL